MAGVRTSSPPVAYPLGNPAASSLALYRAAGPALRAFLPAPPEFDVESHCDACGGIAVTRSTGPNLYACPYCDVAYGQGMLRDVTAG